MMEQGTPNQPQFIEPDRRTTPLLQGDSELIYSFSVPDAKDYAIDYGHINKDWRMSNLNELDSDYLNKASIAGRMAQSFLGDGAGCVKNVLHDQFIVLNMSVGRKGFGMQMLVTRKQQQTASIERVSRGFMSKKNDEGEEYG